MEMVDNKKIDILGICVDSQRIAAAVRFLSGQYRIKYHRNCDAGTACFIGGVSGNQRMLKTGGSLRCRRM